MKPRVLIPVALGTNRDADLAAAFSAPGAEVECVPLVSLRDGDRRLTDYQLLAIAGGFSYGDALGAGRLLGLDLAGWFGDQLYAAVEASMPVFGVCNGFQALVRAGLLPGDSDAVLTQNTRPQFDCRWVTLEAEANNPSPWLEQLTEPIRCPIAHGEGRFVASDLQALEARNGVAFRYRDNPNGSDADIAGVTDPSGLVLGMMPHPENHILLRQDPLRGRGGSGLCIPLFESGVAAVAA